MIIRRSGALVLTGALTYSFAVAAHTLVHAIGAGDRFVLNTPAHALMLATALAALGLAARTCGLGRGAAEVRRRSALLGAAVRGGGGGLVGAVALQAALVAGLLAAENASLEPGRLAEAIVCGALASVVAAFAVRALRARLPAALAALYAVHRRVARAATALAPSAPSRPRHLLSARSRPVRAPPTW